MQSIKLEISATNAEANLRRAQSPARTVGIRKFWASIATNVDLKWPPVMNVRTATLQIRLENSAGSAELNYPMLAKDLMRLPKHKRSHARYADKCQIAIPNTVSPDQGVRAVERVQSIWNGRERNVLWKLWVGGPERSFLFKLRPADKLKVNRSKDD